MITVPKEFVCQKVAMLQGWETTRRSDPLNKKDVRPRIRWINDGVVMALALSVASHQIAGSPQNQVLREHCDFDETGPTRNSDALLAIPIVGSCGYAVRRSLSKIDLLHIDEQRWVFLIKNEF